MSQSSNSTVTKPAVLANRYPFYDLGEAAFNMSYAAFRQALELDDDDYAIDKYQQFQAIGRAMCAFSDTTLAILVDEYQASRTR